MNRRRRAMVAGLLLVFVGGLVATAFAALPRRPVPTEAYFDQLERGRVNADVEATIALIDPLFEQAPEDWACMGLFPEEGYKYSLAFTGYGLASVAVIDPSRRPEVARRLDRLIERMRQPVVWKDWVDQGWGTDPLVENVMYKGHLNLLYALHTLLTAQDLAPGQRPKYEEPYRAMSAVIAKDMKSGSYCGACCEIINYFFQCNQISMFSLALHDVFYGTSYRAELERPWLDWARKNMTDPETGLFYFAYHPRTDNFDKRLSGYTNAWIVTFLHFFDPEWADELYDSFKARFVQERFGVYAYAEEWAGRGMEGLATMFTLFAAKEMGDQALFDKILNLLSKAGRDEYDSGSPEIGMVEIDLPTCIGIQGPLLFGKTNVGLTRLYAEAHRLPEKGEDR